MAIGTHSDFLLQIGFEQVLPSADNSVNIFFLPKAKRENVQEIATAISNLIKEDTSTLAQALHNSPYLSEEEGALKPISLEELGDIYIRFNNYVEAMAIYRSIRHNVGVGEKLDRATQHVSSGPHSSLFGKLIKATRSGSEGISNQLQLGNIFYEIGLNANSPTHLRLSIEYLIKYLGQDMSSENQSTKLSNYLETMAKISKAYDLLGEIALSKKFREESLKQSLLLLKSDE